VRLKTAEDGLVKSPTAKASIRTKTTAKKKKRRLLKGLSSPKKLMTNLEN
jgi:hypothetical protein